MQRIKITLPAALTDFGVGIGSLGLALRLHMTAEVRPRDDDQFTFEILGEGKDDYPDPLRHPFMVAMIRIFQQHERAPMGITIKLDNQIPLAAALGAQTAFTLAGVFCAHNILNISASRDEIMRYVATQVGRADGVVTALLGGLTTTLARTADELIYRSLAIKPLELILTLPELPNYMPPTREETIPVDAALGNIRQMPLLLEALRSGDHKQLAIALEDQIYAPIQKAQIPTYEAIVEAARRTGASAMTVCAGPLLLTFAERNHPKIAESITHALTNAGVKSRSWVLPIDTQGIVLSIAQSAG